MTKETKLLEVIGAFLSEDNVSGFQQFFSFEFCGKSYSGSLKVQTEKVIMNTKAHIENKQR